MSELTSKLTKMVSEVISYEGTAEEKASVLQANLLSWNIGQGNHLEGMLDKIEGYGVTVPTGYPEIDLLLHGGFRTGLNIITAPPGNGKTTLVEQFAEGFSSRGIQTVYVTNDMSEEELIAKSISRHSYLLAKDMGFTAEQILRYIGELRGSELFQKALDSFRGQSQYLRFIGDETGSNLADLKTLISHYVAYGTGTDEIVIIIDYLQMISANADDGSKLSDKERLDKIVMELKGLAKNHKLVIIAISSTNRASYHYELSMESLKESGGIEFGADLVLGLQYFGVGKDKFDWKKAQKAPVRAMELVVLKQRMGNVGTSLAIKYNPKYNIIPFDEMTF